MSSIQYLDNYLKSLEYLPTDLQRNFNLMRVLDVKTQELLKRIGQSSDNLINNMLDDDDVITSDNIRAAKNELQKQYNLANDYSEHKVLLATQSYELVDKSIRRLDVNITKLKQAMEKIFESRNELVTGELKALRIDEASVVISKRKRNIRDFIKGKKRKLPSAPTMSKQVNIVRKYTKIAQEYEMTVNPNEPTYCSCAQVSYGEMIACDHPKCSIEWFHFACVGITSKPKGKWVCDDCSN